MVILPRSFMILLQVQIRIKVKKVIPTNVGDVANSRRFIVRTNRQIVFEIDDMTETLRSTIETMCISQLGKRGLISVYCDVGKSRVVLRTTHALDAKGISEVLFDCGCEMVTQLTKIDGNDERFPMYASERERRLESNRKELPDYLEEGHTFDPSTTLVTKAHAQESGWLSSVTSYVKWW
ncbi:unnamed protein product, partial [Mesorhabditis belari]|uniref:Uncharacterized protein n=1 Tax=Mesorhabditis belari TaxID=2138241 RepID=A0AAF3EDC5_9BILA